MIRPYTKNSDNSDNKHIYYLKIIRKTYIQKQKKSIMICKL